MSSANILGEEEAKQSKKRQVLMKMTFVYHLTLGVLEIQAVRTLVQLVGILIVTFCTCR